MENFSKILAKTRMLFKKIPESFILKVAKHLIEKEPKSRKRKEKTYSTK